MSNSSGSHRVPPTIGTESQVVSTVGSDEVVKQSSRPGTTPARVVATVRHKGGAASGNGPTIDHIGTSLRRAYESTLEEDVPESILDLLRQLD